MEGQIVAFWPDRHYGFIADLASPTEYFFHTTDVFPGVEPQKGRNVTFDVGPWRGRQKATNVRVTVSPAEVLAGKGGAE